MIDQSPLLEPGRPKGFLPVAQTISRRAFVQYVSILLSLGKVPLESMDSSTRTKRVQRRGPDRIAVVLKHLFVGQAVDPRVKFGFQRLRGPSRPAFQIAPKRIDLTGVASR